MLNGVPLADRTVGERIQRLEERRSALSGLIMREQERAKRNQLESELRAVEAALTHYRSALEFESRVWPPP